MVHNGIEYGLMAAYAEGLNIIANADAGLRERDRDAETAPLENPEWYRYDIDTAEVAEVWRRGSVISSWLLDLAAEAMGTFKRPRIGVPLLSPTLSSHWIGLVTPVDAGVAKPLVQGLTTETIVEDPSGMALFDVEPTPTTEYDAVAVRQV